MGCDYYCNLFLVVVDVVYFCSNLYPLVSGFYLFFIYPFHQHLPRNFRSPLKTTLYYVYLSKKCITKVSVFFTVNDGRWCFLHEILSVNSNVTPSMKDDAAQKLGRTHLICCYEKCNLSRSS